MTSKKKEKKESNNEESVDKVVYVGTTPPKYTMNSEHTN